MDPVVINDVQVCLYLNSQYSLVLSLCSSKHTFCEARSMELEQFKRTVEDIKGGGAELLEEKNQFYRRYWIVHLKMYILLLQITTMT
jgi:hypothetical protein